MHMGGSVCALSASLRGTRSGSSLHGSICAAQAFASQLKGDDTGDEVCVATAGEGGRDEELDSVGGIWGSMSSSSPRTMFSLETEIEAEFVEEKQQDTCFESLSAAPAAATDAQPGCHTFDFALM